MELQLPAGRVHAERHGAQDGPLVICVHGLSANVRGFDAIIDALDDRLQVVVFDLRGRGRSEITPAGTYGLDSHAADVIAIADALGAQTFDLVGWSLGALIGMKVAAAHGERLRRLVLLDHAGHTDAQAVELIKAGLARLDAVTPSREAYVNAIRELGAVDPWSAFWDRYYGYEIVEREDGGWSPSTDRAACTEDLEIAMAEDEGWHERVWPALTMPALLVRATVPLGGGLIVPAAERDALAQVAPRLRVLELDRNHYTIMDDPRTAAAVSAFLEPTEA